MIAESITAELYLAMLERGAGRLDEKRGAINDLNVFPIPDGDTGDNMYMTISSGVQAGATLAVGNGPELGEMAGKISKGMLMGARGNSGVILSRIFAGISMGLEGLHEAGLQQFREAMLRGVKEAYGAVSHPVEGTILTVIRESVEKAAGDNPIQYFEALVQEMRASLKRTPELLGVLKEAGVVDSGGAGMLCISEGMLDALRGWSPEADAKPNSGAAAASATVSAPKYNLDDFGPDSELEFGYCTEFLLRLQTAKVGDVNAFDVNEIKNWLTANGDSVVCFADGSIVKVHVHTKDPGAILTKARCWGEFLTLKIENMTLQHSEVTIRDNFSEVQTESDADGDEEEVFAPRKPYGIVAVASGEGLVQAFKDAGADVVIEGGQTMNPSAASFVEAFGSINAETIFVLPNNSNIIMTARQAAEVAGGGNTGKRIVVLESKDPAAGYVTLASMDLSEKNPAALEESSRSTIAATATAMVSKATRDAQMDGVEICKGDFIGISGGRIIAAGKDRKDLVQTLAEKISLGGSDVALVFSGAGVPAQEAQETADALMKAHPRTEIMLNDGGQPVYDYIMALC